MNDVQRLNQFSKLVMEHSKEKLKKKPSWGSGEVLSVIDEAVIESLFEILEDVLEKKKE